MVRGIERAHRYYFFLPEPYFWGWQDDCTVAAWSDGTTIAFRRELYDVLESISHRGLPSLSVAMLILAACQENFRESFHRSKQEIVETLLGLIGSKDLHVLVARVFRSLDIIHTIWREQRREPRAKAILIRAVLESAANLPFERQQIADILKLLDSSAPLGGFLSLDPDVCRSVLVHDLEALDHAINVLSLDSLRLRIRTGIDELVEPTKLEVPPGAVIRDLLDELDDDEQLGGVARLARLLMASVSLPRRISDIDELPHGGVSEVTNRGTLDRLLTSELAHDDLTLAVRVAMREALYLRREGPPQALPSQRHILLDSGLRVWGVPRLFVTSVGLALAAVHDSAVAVKVFRTIRDELATVDFTTREGIIEHLAALDHRVHPMGALATLRERIEANNDAAEIVLVTGEDVLEDRDARAKLAELCTSELYVVTVTREGKCRLRLLSPRGKKLIRETTFDLDEILKPKSKQQRLVPRSVVDGLPAIFGEQKFPLLLSTQSAFRRIWRAPNYGTLTILNDGRLLRWTHISKGGEQIGEELPRGDLHGVGTQGLQNIAVVGDLQQANLYALHIDLVQGFKRATKLETSQPRVRAVAVENGVVLVIYAKHCDVFDPITGHHICSQRIPDPMIWKRGRIFNLPDTAWYVLGYDGQRPTWSSVYYVRGQKKPVTVIDTAEGLVAVFDTCEVEYVRTDATWKFYPKTVEGGEVGQVSLDGSRFAYYLPMEFGPPTYNSRVLLVDVTKKTAYPTFPHSVAISLPTYEHIRTRTLRRRFRAMTLDAYGQLTLISRRDTRWPIRFDEKKQAILFPDRAAVATSLSSSVTIISNRTATTTSEPHYVRFEPCAGFEDSPYDLKLARWSDGSQAILDARGLLHLKSSDRTLPEFTIVLQPGATAGWVADGRVWGEEYFVGNQPPTAASEIQRTVLGPFLERLR